MAPWGAVAVVSATEAAEGRKGLHSFRPSRCSHLLASGVPLPAVSARLGRRTQEIYSHMIHGQDDLAARKWEELINRVGSSRRACAVKLCATEWQRRGFALMWISGP